VRRKIFILIVSVVLFSLFNTIDTNFSVWETPSINTDYINSPDVPVDYNPDISVLGLVTNFYFQLNNSIDTSISSESLFANDFLTSDDVSLDVVTGSTFEEELVVDEVASKPLVKQDASKSVVKSKVILKPVVEKEISKPVIKKEISKPVIKKEISKPVIKKEISKPVVKKEVSKPVIKRELSKPVANEVEEDLLPTDEEIIQQHPNIKKSAKKIILDALEEGVLTMEDVFNLLNKYAGKDLSKSKVKQFIKKKRR
jgi:hypothetical protein